MGKNRLLKCNGLIKGLFKHILLKEEVKWNNAPYYFLELITRTMIHYETILLPTNMILDNHPLFIRYRSLPFQIYQDDICLTLKNVHLIEFHFIIFITYRQLFPKLYRFPYFDDNQRVQYNNRKIRYHLH